MKQVIIAASVAMAAAALSTGALAQQKKTVLSLATAKKMGEACEALAKEKGWKLNIAILDTGGNLKYFVRQDDAFMGSIQIAQLKANTSAMFPFSTKVVGDIAQRIPGIAHVPGLVTFEGGLPIMAGNGDQVGSIGVSGASAADDGLCAQAAIDAVKEDLQ
ncbi:MAG: heme-binding protein [Betaproteobacteria bacterium]|nr:heme-binding protein [Betaproteobacteria bacterium]